MIWTAVIIAVAIWLLTGIYTVGPGEVGIVRTFGKHTATTSSGLNYHWPWPIQKAQTVDIEEVRSGEVGFTRAAGRTRHDYPLESKMLTGDGNIAKVWLEVQYQVTDAEAFVFNVRDPEEVVHSAAEVVLRAVVGQMRAEDVLTTGRIEISRKTKEELQGLLSSYGTGIEVLTVNIIDTFPPEAVNAAYEDVSTARQDKDKLMNEARGYAADRVPRARGEKEKVVLEAQAYREQRVLEAQGDAAKFLEILREHEVPAAFEALADYGVAAAQQALRQIAGISGASAVEVGVVPAASGSPSGEIVVSTSLTRRALLDILTGLGAVGPIEPEEFTGETLVEALSVLDLDDEFREVYNEAIRLTGQRLYLETMEDVLSGKEKYVVDPETGGNLLPFLPLKGLDGTAQSPGAQPTPTPGAGQNGGAAK